MTTWNAQDYSRNSSQQQVWARELIDKLNLTGTEQVLDIGCGDGKVSAEIARRVPDGSVVGIDVSPEMVRFATETFPRAEHPNLSFRHVDASAMTFDTQFDVTFSNAVLHWIQDHRPVLSGISHALRPTGRILLQMGGKGNAVDVLSTLNEVVREPEWAEHFDDFRFRYGFYSPEEYCPWLTEAGLEAQRVELIPKDMVHASPDAFEGWFRTTWMPWILSVPERRQTSFIDQVVARYVESNPPDEQGRVHVKMVRLEVEATKSPPRKKIDPWP